MVSAGFTGGEEQLFCIFIQAESEKVLFNALLTCTFALRFFQNLLPFSIWSFSKELFSAKVLRVNIKNRSISLERIVVYPGYRPLKYSHSFQNSPVYLYVGHH